MVVLVLLLALLEPLPPLSGAVMESLEEVEDDRDAPDAGFLALLKQVRTWPPEASPVDGAMELDHDEFVSSPASHRGVLVMITGRLEQVKQLARPLEKVQEWFVRPPGGRPVMVYVPSPGKPLVRPGDDVTLGGYFYKRLQIEDRQGVLRAYPVFIGGQPRVVMLESQEVEAALRDARAHTSRMVMVIAGLVGLVLVMVGLMVFIRRSKRKSRRPGIFGEVDPEPPMPSLPEDPAEAMAELMRRNNEDS